MNEEEYMQGDLNATYRRSMELGFSIQAAAIKMSREQHMRRNPRKLREYQKSLLRIRRQNIKQQTKKATIYQELQSQNQSLIKRVRREKLHASKLLRKSLRHLDHSLRQNKAGKTIYALSQTQEEFLPQPIQQFKAATQPNSNTESPRLVKLPVVSLYQGKPISGIDLQSYNDFCNASKEQNDRLSKQCEDKYQKTLQRYENFTKQLDGLEIFCNVGRGLHWNKDQKVLLDLQQYPESSKQIMQQYRNNAIHRNKQRSFSQFASSTERSPARTTAKTPHNNGFPSNQTSRATLKVIEKEKTDYLETIQDEANLKSLSKSKPDGEQLIVECLNQFQSMRNNADTTLWQIIQRLDNDRPANHKERLKYLLKDTEQFKNRMHCFRLFQRIKQVLDSNRIEQSAISRNQGKLYQNLLEKYKHNGVKLSKIEEALLNTVRAMLENGYAMTEYHFTQIFNIIPAEELKNTQLIKTLKKISKFIPLTESQFKKFISSKNVN